MENISSFKSHIKIFQHVSAVPIQTYSNYKKKKQFHSATVTFAAICLKIISSSALYKTIII